MTKPLILTKDQWEKLREKLKQDLPASTWLIRSKMRDKLGFTDREHSVWLGDYDRASLEDRINHNYGYKNQIHLDFYNESKRTMFLLKYSEFINDL